ncbi:hypothetical protein NE398_07810 [Clostridium tertium]|uniref:Uncharacterized protein n=1 Tax=Clostridium tertium TaxID=1559 RepID=A0A9X4B0U6_9CLOT|nr:hypothetical protein [Clostridium tertium]MDC4240067.1 hypothetical protein [Clostridium tertium]
MNKDLFEDELNKLDEEIRLGCNTFKFKVFDLEASSGKTRQTIESAIKSKRETLIVTKFKVEVDRIVKEINKGAGFKKAVGIVSDVDMINNKDLVLSANFIDFYKYSVIVITHSQYYKLCKGENNRLARLVETFKTLIIDEEFNPIKNNLYTFAVKKNLEMLDLFLTFNMSAELKEISDVLEVQFKNDEYKPTNQLHWINLKEDLDNIKLKCSILKKEIVKNEANINIKLLDDYKKSNKKRYISDLTEYIDLLERVIFNSIEGYSVIDVTAKIIATYDYNFSFFKLTNNIMLDASASFSSIYKANLFNVEKTNRKISHDKCKMTVVNLKTTTTGKGKINHLFRPKFTTYVTKELGDNKKGLIVTKNDESDYLKNITFSEFDKEIKDEIELLNSDKDIFSEKLVYEERVSFCNYENQRGRNDYAEYNHCFLAHTYRQPRFYYIFLYRYFFGIKPTSKEMETTFKKDKDGLKTWGFHNCDKLQELMFTDMVSCQYQSLKRVARNRDPQAHYHIFTDDAMMVNEIIKQLNGFNMDNYNVVSEEEFLGERVSKRSKLDIFKDYIEEKLAQGKWEKIKSSELQKKLGISKPTWRDIWTNNDFLEFCKTKRIKEGKVKGTRVNHVYKY